MTRLVQRLLIALVVAYRRLVSPGLGNHCRYHPSCAVYAEGCLERYGALRGSALAIWRLLRCNPLSRGGYDPVPELRTAIPHTVGERLP